MIIILGIKVREIERSSGEFYCPHCHTSRPYKLKRYAKYFTLFFIPLFQLKNLGEQVECQKCFMSFNLKVLEHSPKIKTTPAKSDKKPGAEPIKSRAPFQVLVFPYRQAGDTEYEHAILRRADEGYWHVVAGGGELEISSAGFMEFISRLKTHNIIRWFGELLTAGDVVDHEKSSSIYFVDPYEYNYEITIYDYAFVAARL